MITVTQKRRNRATRLKRALEKEKHLYGQIDDGAGKRYRIGPLHVLAGDSDKALDYYRWYEEMFPDDVGEPLHYVYWALALYRAGNRHEADWKLLETLISNIYLLPMLIGEKVTPRDIWHSSNRDDPSYLSDIPEEFHPDCTPEEVDWIKTQLNSVLFQRVLREYVATYQALKGERRIEKRRAILIKWNAFLRRAFEGS